MLFNAPFRQYSHPLPPSKNGATLRAQDKSRLNRLDRLASFLLEAAMVNGCEECVRLWREYAIATHQHFHLDSKLQLAGLSHDHGWVQRLTPEVTKSCHSPNCGARADYRTRARAP